MRVEGLEPPHISAPEPKSGVSTNSTILARSFQCSSSPDGVKRKETESKTGEFLRRGRFDFVGQRFQNRATGSVVPFTILREMFQRVGHLPKFRDLVL